MRHHRARTLIATGILALVASFTTIAVASPGSGGVTTVLASRAPLSDSVQVNDEKIKFQTKDATDFLVQTITFQPNGFSGWHYHPGVVMVVVQSGQITTHDENCQTRTYGPHETFVESGTTPFMVSNESSTENAVVYATLIVAAGSPFRIETDPPPCA